MPARSTDVRRRIAQVGVAVEAPPRPQAVVARVENEQGSGLSGRLLSESAQQSPDLLGGDRVRFLIRTDALHVYRGGPALAHEAQLCDELVGPACDDGLACGVAGWMVVEAALGARLRIAAGPHAHVHGVDGLLVLCPGERVTGEQAAQGLGVYSPMPQRGVEAAPSATMGRLETQVDRRRYGVCAEESVGELEEGVGPAVETRVERVAERAKGVKSVESFHDATIMHSPAASRTFRPPAGLKRKLRGCRGAELILESARYHRTIRAD